MPTSEYLDHAILDHVYGRTTFTAPATLYLAYTTTVPTKTTAGTEPSGGGYARKDVVNDDTQFGDAVAGVKTNLAQITWPDATGTQGRIVAVQIMDAATDGNMLEFAELLDDPTTFTADPATDLLTATAHGRIDDDQVEVDAENGTLPGGLADNTNYYVVTSTTNTLQLAATLGGTPIDITTTGSGTLRLWDSYKQDINSANRFFIPVGGLKLERL